ncbi:NAD-dependent epimerase/dehydratase family protein [Actinocorallia sp. A-T 12471]|uniref:NAD-dependent epimerase/dehydratase family protein n=1 Tax=Actinocorallia sp. A-T 12471 TaxID=3089813 RepID=UPI0029CD8A90|nr:NAD-dependent epimerase/dehydratase family protein [Actinocorallia sp. A-T 12471]MDX6738883.1 NAD-dependent epimerase/dehydratase family protein [Actinocorallia sp. A-T 12471]
MRILVTGAAGFIGSHLVDRLLGDGHEVVAVDNLVSGNRANLADSVELHDLDVADPAFKALAVKVEPEVICHLAAQVSVRVSVADPLRDAHTNVLGTVNVLEAARAAGARKTVYTSSCAVYGVPDALPVGGDAPLRPRSPYAASKTTGETYLGAYRDLHGLDFTTIVPGNVYGPRQTPEGEAGVVSIFTAALLKGEPTIVFGDGGNTRDYVYVLDVVDAYARALESGSGGRFNIGTGVQTSDRALHTLVARVAGAADEPGSAPFRLGDLPAMALDPAPALAGLGWRPTTALEDGLEATVEWARSR